MKFSAKLLLCAVVPAVLFIVGLAGSIGGLVHTKNQFSRYIQTEQRISAGFNEMYAQGLQMGQALRNAMLDPGNPKAYDNYTKAADAFDNVAGKARGLDEQHFASGLPARVQTLRDTQKQIHERIFALVKDGRGEEARALLNKDETPKWREMRDLLLAEIKRLDEASPRLLAELKAASDAGIRRSLG